MDWISRLPPWLASLALMGIAGAFIYVAVVRPVHFKFANLEFGTVQQADLSLSRAVVAFANTVDVDDRVNQCPDGWTPFEEGRGRFLMGAGIPTHSKYRTWRAENIPESAEMQLTGRSPMEHGGEETHLLSVPEMPTHTHEFDGQSITRGGNHGTGRTLAVGDAANHGEYKPDGENAKVGGSNAHNNLPPYIALYFCRMP